MLNERKILYPVIVAAISILMVTLPSINKLLMPNIFNIKELSRVYSSWKLTDSRLRVSYDLGKYVEKFKLELNEKIKNRYKFAIQDLLKLNYDWTDQDILDLENDIIKNENYNDGYTYSFLFIFFILLFLYHTIKNNTVLNVYFIDFFNFSEDNNIIENFLLFIVFIIYNTAFRFSYYSFEVNLLSIIAFLFFTLVYYLSIDSLHNRLSKFYYKMENQEELNVKKIELERSNKNNLMIFSVIIFLKSFIFSIILKSYFFGFISILCYLLMMYHLNEKFRIFDYIKFLNNEKEVKSILISSFYLYNLYLIINTLNYFYFLLIEFKYGFLFSYVLFHILLGQNLKDSSVILTRRNILLNLISFINQIIYIFTSKAFNNLPLYGISVIFFMFWLVLISFKLISLIKFKSYNNIIMTPLKIIYIIICIDLWIKFVNNNSYISYIVNN